MKERAKTFFRNATKKTQAFLREIWLKLPQLSESLSHILASTFFRNAVKKTQAFHGEIWLKLCRFLGKLFRASTTPIYLLLAFLIAVLFWATVDPDFYKFVKSMLSDEKIGSLTFIGSIIVGLILLLRALSAEKLAEAMTKAADNQATANKLVEVGHRQERLKTAIEHLGNDKESVRIGAAYELYHLAKDQSDFKETICRILCGHIRQKTQEEEYQKRYSDKPSEEIQTFIDTLCRNKEHPFNKHINLSPSFLIGVNLQKAQLQGASLHGVQLQGASLQKAQLQGANLNGSRLQGANLYEAQLQGANLLRAQLQGASILMAQLQGVALQGAQLQGAFLHKAQLQVANLNGAQLQGANLNEAQLQGANLYAAQLQGVHSRNAKCYSLFKDRIGDRAEKNSELSGVIFSGELDKEQVTQIIEKIPPKMPDKEKEALREKLNQHIGQPTSHNLPENSGAETGVYTQAQAEKWIQEYEKAMRSVPATFLLIPGVM